MEVPVPVNASHPHDVVHACYSVLDDCFWPEAVVG